jgi:hypothetical protein
MQNPENLSSFWSYFTLQEHGVPLFFEKIFPRHGPFWEYQIKEMYLRYFNWNFVGRADNPSTVFSLDGLWGIPLLVGTMGIIYYLTKDWRRALFFVLAFLLTSLGAVIYLNVPVGFFREIHRHFLPSFLIFSLWIGLGVFNILQTVTKSFVRNHPAQRIVLATATALLFLAFPANLTRLNWERCQGH